MGFHFQLNGVFFLFVLLGFESFGLPSFISFSMRSKRIVKVLLGFYCFL